MQERDTGYTPVRSIFCMSHIWVEADIPVCKIVLHALGSGCSMALLWSFHPAVVSLLSPEKLSDNHPLRKLRQRDRINITSLNEWCRQTKKSMAWNRTWVVRNLGKTDQFVRLDSECLFVRLLVCVVMCPSKMFRYLTPDWMAPVCPLDRHGIKSNALNNW